VGQPCTVPLSEALYALRVEAKYDYILVMNKDKNVDLSDDGVIDVQRSVLTHCHLEASTLVV
jgi:hypothetical protein